MAKAPALLILIFILALTGVWGQPSEPIKVIVVDGTIDGGYGDLVARHLYTSDPGEPVIIYLRTNGGYLKPTQDIVTAILESGANVTVFVPRGGFAFSAGVYISLSAETLAMGPGSSIGSAEPRDLSGNVDPKVLNAMVAWIESIAEARGRNVTAARLMVLENLNLPAEEALRLGVADLLVGDLAELLDILGLSGRPVEYVEKDARSHLLAMLTDPFILGILLNIAALLILIELFNPTYIGMVVAAALLVMAFLGLGILGADSTAVILMLIGAFAIVMETWFGEGELAVAGAIMTILGILLLYRGEYFIWTLNMRLLVIGGMILLIAGVGFFGFYLHKIRETLAMRESPLEKSRLVGMRGVAKSDIVPGKPGIVHVAGDDWTARSDVYIPKDSEVVVEKVEGLVLWVRPAEEAG